MAFHLSCLVFIVRMSVRRSQVVLTQFYRSASIPSFTGRSRTILSVGCRYRSDVSPSFIGHSRTILSVGCRSVVHRSFSYNFIGRMSVRRSQVVLKQFVRSDVSPSVTGRSDTILSVGCRSVVRNVMSSSLCSRGRRPSIVVLISSLSTVLCRS